MTLATFSQTQIAPSTSNSGGEAAERQQFYTLLWSDTAGWVEVVAGLDAPELARRGWLRANERADDTGIKMLEMTRTSFDEDRANNRPHERKLFRWPTEAAALDQYVEQCHRRYGNVYTCISPYAYRSAGDSTQSYTVADTLPRYPNKPGNKLSGPLPSCVLLVEDGPAHPPLPYSACVETSADSRHGYYRLHAPLGAAALSRLGQGAARKLGADTSGFDREQRIRIPTTRNTKPKNGSEGHRVTLLFTDGPQYTAEQLARAFLPGGVADLGSTSSDGATPRQRSTGGNDGRDVGTGDEAWRKASYRNALDEAAKPWRQHLEPGGLLLNADGFPRRLKPSQKGYQILQAVRRGEMTFTSASGNWDASRERYHVMLSLMFVGYDDGQIVALAEHLANFGEPVKGSDAIQLDIHRLICTLNAELGAKRRITPISFKGSNAGAGAQNYAPEEAPTYVTGADGKQYPAQRHHTPRANRGKGRPRVAVDAPQLLGFYVLRASEGAYTSTRKADASAMGISVQTLNRLDRTLKDRGVIAVERQGNGRTVALLGCAKNAAPVVPKPAAQGCAIRAVQPIVEPDSVGEASREYTPRLIPPASPGLPALGATTAGADVAAAAGVPSPEAEPTPPPPAPAATPFPESKQRDLPNMERVAAHFRQQGAVVRVMERHEQQAGDLELTWPDGRVETYELKTEDTTRRTGNLFLTIRGEALTRAAYATKHTVLTSKADWFLHFEPISGTLRAARMAQVQEKLGGVWLARYGETPGPMNPYGVKQWRDVGVCVPISAFEQVQEWAVTLPDPVAAMCAHIRRLYPGRRLATLGQLVCDNAPDLDADDVRAELERQRTAATTEKRRTALERQCATLAERAKKWRLKVLEAKAKSYGSKAAEDQRAGKAGSAYVWRRLGGVIEAEIVRRTDVAAEDEAINAEIALVADRHAQQLAPPVAESETVSVLAPTPPAPVAEQLSFADARTPERPQDAPDVAHEGEDTAPPRSAVPGGAGESTDPYSPAEYAAFAEIGERIRQGRGLRQRVSVAA